MNTLDKAPTLARAVELGAALHSSTIAGVATATCYETRAMANAHTLAYLEQGWRVAETVPVQISEPSRNPPERTSAAPDG